MSDVRRRPHLCERLDAQPSFAVVSNANCKRSSSRRRRAPARKAVLPVRIRERMTGFVNAFAPTMFRSQLRERIDCSVATPCFTSSTAQNNSGLYGFGTPVDALEYDNSAATRSTTSIRRNNIYTSVSTLLNDTTAIRATLAACGRLHVHAAGGAAASHATRLSAGLRLVAGYKATPLAIPRRSIRDLDCTHGAVPTEPKLEFDFGNYFTIYKILASREPGLLNSFGARKSPPAIRSTRLAPIVLSPFINGASHYDPHSASSGGRSQSGDPPNGRFSISVPYASSFRSCESDDGDERLCVTVPDRTSCRGDRG